MALLEKLILRSLITVVFIVAVSAAVITPLLLIYFITTIENRAVAYSTLLPMLIITVVAAPYMVKELLLEVIDTYKLG